MTVGSTYTVCSEDEGKRCSDSTLDLNHGVSRNSFSYEIRSYFQDHDYYFNLHFKFAKQGCPGYNPYYCNC